MIANLMKKTELIDAHFKELLDMANQLEQTSDAIRAGMGTHFRASVQNWSTRAAQLLDRLFGRDSGYYQDFAKNRDNAWAIDLTGTAAVLRAAWNDYSKGYIFDIKSLMRAEVFDDFLEQAEHLLALGYFQAAAVLCGGVLEDALRKLCDQDKKITLSSKRKIDSMNAELAKQGVYNTLVQKRITALADLRNKAAHSQPGFSQADVEQMLRQVRDFVTEHSV